MSKYIKNFKKRMSLDTSSKKELIVSEIRRNFEVYLDESPTAVEVNASVLGETTVTPTSRKILCSITDITQNDKRNFDEKIIQVRHDEDIDLGCYLYWQNNYWLIVYQEHKAVEGSRKYIMKKCNQIIKFVYDKKVYELPVVIRNLTLYSDGMADAKHTSRQDAKRNILIGKHIVSENMFPNHRIMLTNRTVFRITNYDDFSFPGIIEILIIQTELNAKDDKVNNLAWNGEDVEVEEPVPPVQEDKVEGDSDIYLGCTNTYTFKDEIEVEYGLELDENCSFEYMTLEQEDKYSCTIKATSRSIYVGKSATLKVYDKKYNILEEKKITLHGFF